MTLDLRAADEKQKVATLSPVEGFALQRHDIGDVVSSGTVGNHVHRLPGFSAKKAPGRCRRGMCVARVTQYDRFSVLP